MKIIQKFYRNRFHEEHNIIRERIWTVLCKQVFQKLINRSDTLIDLGAGYCEFINNINCQVKIAVDLNPDSKKRAKEGIEVINTDVLSLSKNLDGKADVVFMSNFLEHLNSKSEVVAVLERSYKLLKKEGKIIVVQPNIDLVKEKYWDFIDHTVPLNLSSLKEALETVGFEIKVATKKFLPYTTKNNLTLYADLFLRLYLLIPSNIRPFAGQSLVIAKK